MSATTNQPVSIDAPEGAEDLFKEYALAEAAYVQAKEALKPLRDKLLALFPHEVGDFVMTAGKWELEVSYPEKWSWNSDELAAYYGADLPVHVKRTLAINSSDFKRLPQAERDAIIGAREIKPGTPKLSLIVNGGGTQ